MSGVITFRLNQPRVWGVAGWAFRLFMNEVRSCFPNDEQFVFMIGQAIALNGITAEMEFSESPELALRLQNTIREVATKLASADPEMPLIEGLDVDEWKDYQSSIRALLADLNEYEFRPKVGRIADED